MSSAHHCQALTEEDVLDIFELPEMNADEASKTRSHECVMHVLPVCMHM